MAKSFSAENRYDERPFTQVMLIWLLLCLTALGSTRTLAAQGGVGGGGGGGGGGGVFVTAAGLPPLAPAQFDITGFIQEATLDTTGSLCKATDSRLAGGTLKVNNIRVIIPCNTILQMPASTLTWQEVFSLAPRDIGLPLDGNGIPTQTGLALADKVKLPVSTPYNGPLPSYEAHVQGNIVDGQYIAGLVFLSQQNLNLAQGVITAIDYDNGELQIATKGLKPGVARVKINDPLGRFGLSHGAPGSKAVLVEPGYDIRFSIDEDNPTVHAATGFPMCIPRSDPFSNGDDPDCTQSNRPRSPNCASLPSPFPAFAMPASGQFCTSFMMPPASGIACTPSIGVSCPPDPTLQVPFEVGDFIDYMGTLKVDSKGAYISAHTLIAHLGVYTTPGTMPAYLSIEVELQGTAAQPVANLPQETTSRIKVEGFSTDPSALVDIYAVDVNPLTGVISDRLLGAANPSGPPVIGRFRFKPFSGAFAPPTREFRVVSRTLCGNPSQPCMFSGSPTTYANGIIAGQYHAPNFEFVFPENLTLGDAIVPANFQDLIFLFCGSGPLSTPTAGGNSPFVGQLDPPPWGLPMNNPIFGIFCPAARRIGAPPTTVVTNPVPVTTPTGTTTTPTGTTTTPTGTTTTLTGTTILPTRARPTRTTTTPTGTTTTPTGTTTTGTTTTDTTTTDTTTTAGTTTGGTTTTGTTSTGTTTASTTTATTRTITSTATTPTTPVTTPVASAGLFFGTGGAVGTANGTTTPGTQAPADATTPAANVSSQKVVEEALPPVVSAMATPDPVEVNQIVVLNAVASDPNTPAKPLTYSWTQVGWPAVAITNATKESAAFTAPSVTTPTTLTFNVAVRNSATLITNATVSVVVNPLMPPPSVSFKAPASASAGSKVSLNGTVSTGSSYSWKQTAGSPVTLNHATTLNPEFIAPPGPATLTFVLMATNPTGVSATATRTIQVGSDEISIGPIYWNNLQGKGRLEVVAKSATISLTTPTPPSGMSMTATLWNSALPSSANGSASHPVSVQMNLVKDVPGKDPVCASPLPCFQLAQSGMILDPNSSSSSPVFVAPTMITVKSSLGGVASATGTKIQLR